MKRNETLMVSGKRRVAMMDDDDGDTFCFMLAFWGWVGGGWGKGVSLDRWSY